MAIRQKLSALQQPSLQTMVNEDNITPVHSEKLLGVTIEKSLNWSEHISKTVSNVARRLAQLRRIKCYLPRADRVAYYIWVYCTTF